MKVTAKKIAETTMNLTFGMAMALFSMAALSGGVVVAGEYARQYPVSLIASAVFIGFGLASGTMAACLLSDARESWLA